MVNEFTFGDCGQKGSLNKGLEEAIKLWLKEA